MNWRKPIYLSYCSLRGYRFPSILAQYSHEYKHDEDDETSARALTALLRHCRQSVPYYAEKMRGLEASSLDADPIKCLSRLPILTKEAIRIHFGELQSADLGRRKWSSISSGGSTGEPIRLIQDREYEDRCLAVSMLCHAIWGREVGQPLIRLWGSEREIEAATHSTSAKFFNWLTNAVWLYAFNPSPSAMRKNVDTLNQKGPGVVFAYASAAYELAQFAEREEIFLLPQRAVVVPVGTLHPFMREKISRVFGCPVYRIYGSREVSHMGCEIPEVDGLWVPPWSNFVEILDDEGNPVQPGEEGNIVVTCLTNFAMPLVRYWIGERGALNSKPAANGHATAQVLKSGSRHNVDIFRTRDGRLVDGEFFTYLLYMRPWAGKFQVVQKSYDHIQFKIVQANGELKKNDLEGIAAKSRSVMGDNCRIDFEFPESLPQSDGRFCSAISEVALEEAQKAA